MGDPFVQGPVKLAGDALRDRVACTGQRVSTGSYARHRFRNSKIILKIKRPEERAKVPMFYRSTAGQSILQKRHSAATRERGQDDTYVALQIKSSSDCASGVPIPTTAPIS